MSHPDFVIRGRNVVLRKRVRDAAVHVSGGRIVRLAAFDDVPAGCEVVELDDDAVLSPGLVDTHVHVNEPGRTEWEGFETATRAAAAGGVTTIADMPLNSVPPTTTAEALREKMAAAEGKCAVDVGFWGGVVPGNLAELARLAEAGVCGFKCFLIHSGVAEFPHVTEADLRPALAELKRLGLPLIAHAELPGPVEAASGAVAAGGADPRRYETFLRTRPRAAEDEAVALLIRLCRETGARVHVVHHSSADSLPLLHEALGLPLSAETCPHYLCFAAEEIADGATEFKCCPPIRERENREQLWRALETGAITMIVSDHSPCPPALKLREEGDFLRAWGGIASLQLRLPVVWTLARARGHGFGQLARWLSRVPAGLAGFDGKGEIRLGADADFVVWRPEESFRVAESAIFHRHKLTPYAGMTLSGVVEATYLHGEKIYGRGESVASPRGKFLLRGRGGV